MNNTFILSKNKKCPFLHFIYLIMYAFKTGVFLNVAMLFKSIWHNSFTFFLFVCVDLLHPSQQLFSHDEIISCLPWLNYM